MLYCTRHLAVNFEKLQILVFSPTECICFFHVFPKIKKKYLPEQHYLVGFFFVTGRQCVFCEVENISLYITYTNLKYTLMDSY